MHSVRLSHFIVDATIRPIIWRPTSRPYASLSVCLFVCLSVCPAVANWENVSDVSEIILLLKSGHPSSDYSRQCQECF